MIPDLLSLPLTKSPLIRSVVLLPSISRANASPSLPLFLILIFSFLQVQYRWYLKLVFPPLISYHCQVHFFFPQSLYPVISTVSPQPNMNPYLFPGLIKWPHSFMQLRVVSQPSKLNVRFPTYSVSSKYQKLELLNAIFRISFSMRLHSHGPPVKFS